MGYWTFLFKSPYQNGMIPLCPHVALSKIIRFFSWHSTLFPPSQALLGLCSLFVKNPRRIAFFRRWDGAIKIGATLFISILKVLGFLDYLLWFPFCYHHEGEEIIYAFKRRGWFPGSTTARTGEVEVDLIEIVQNILNLPQYVDCSSSVRGKWVYLKYSDLNVRPQIRIVSKIWENIFEFSDPEKPYSDISFNFLDKF